MAGGRAHEGHDPAEEGDDRVNDRDAMDEGGQRERIELSMRIIDKCWLRAGEVRKKWMDGCKLRHVYGGQSHAFAPVTAMSKL